MNKMIEKLEISNNWKVIRLEETDSTNNYLHNHAEELSDSEFTVAVTDFQVAGKGQRGNSWESSPGKNLLFSILCRPDFLAGNEQFYLSQIISLSIKDTLDKFMQNCSIKWPNDIYWKEKKICGILIENDLLGKIISQSILGEGLNINQESFVSNAPNPVSMAQVIGTALELTDLFEKLMAQITLRYEQLLNDEFETIDREYKAKMWRADNQLYAFKDTKGTFQAKIEGVNCIGQLCLLLPDGEKRVYGFKEVEYIK